MKSANWISATGSRPRKAMPIATPTMPDSARGVSITRSSPNSSIHPALMRKTPPRLPTSSPSRMTRSSAAISSCSASRIAVTTFFSLKGSGLAFEEDVPHRGFGRWIGGVPGGGERGVDLALDLEAEFLRPDVVEDLLGPQVLPEHVHGVVVAGLLHLVPWTVGLVVVVGGVPEEPVGLALDQRGAFAGPGTLVRLLHRRVAGEYVVPVDHHAGEPVAFGPVGDVVHGHLFGLGNADRVVVVLADEDHR